MAYQLKNKLRIKKADEFVFEDEDDDLLILQRQPYETAMSIGHNDYLDHDSTKFFARRSDIIVSSTMSITFMPVDDFKKINFSEISAEEIKQWVDMKQTYRAAFIKQAKLPPEYDFGLMSEFSDYSDPEVFSSLYEDEEDEEGKDPMNLDAFKEKQGSTFGVGRGMKSLPDTLLSQPLPPA